MAEGTSAICAHNASTIACIAPGLNNQILAPKYVNFAMLFIPAHLETSEFRHIIDADGGKIRIRRPQNDKCSKSLFLIEFYQTFDIVRDVVVGAALSGAYHENSCHVFGICLL